MMKKGDNLIEYEIGTVDEIPEGSCKIVNIAGKSIGVFNVNGEFFALRNTCPHQGAELCKGKIVGIHICGESIDDVKLVREGEFIRCPWHGWEFDIKTGKSLIDPKKTYVRSYEVAVKPTCDEELKVETYPARVQADAILVKV